MATRQPIDNEKELFVTRLGKLLESATAETIGEVEQWERERSKNGVNETLPMEDFVNEVHRRLLAKLYDFAQSDGKISMLLIPILGYLRKVPS